MPLCPANVSNGRFPSTWRERDLLGVIPGNNGKVRRISRLAYSAGGICAAIGFPNFNTSESGIVR